MLQRFRNLSVTAILLGLPLLFATGCRSSVIPAREIRIITDPATPVVALVESQEISGAPDSASPPKYQVIAAALLPGPTGAVTVRTRETATHGFFGSYSGQHARVTLFSPGRTARTLYPQESFADAAGKIWLEARFADIKDFPDGTTELVPGGTALGEKYAQDAPVVTLGVPLPPLSNASATAPITDVHARVVLRETAVRFRDQLRALESALDAGALEAVDAESRKTLTRAIEAQWDATEAAKLLQETDYPVIYRVLEKLRFSDDAIRSMLKRGKSPEP